MVLEFGIVREAGAASGTCYHLLLYVGAHMLLNLVTVTASKGTACNTAKK